MTLDSMFPVELWRKIFSYLTRPEGKGLILTCKIFQKIISNDFCWQPALTVTLQDNLFCFYNNLNVYIELHRAFQVRKIDETSFESGKKIGQLCDVVQSNFPEEHRELLKKTKMAIVRHAVNSSNVMFTFRYQICVWDDLFKLQELKKLIPQNFQSIIILPQNICVEPSEFKEHRLRDFGINNKSLLILTDFTKENYEQLKHEVRWDESLFA